MTAHVNNVRKSFGHLGALVSNFSIAWGFWILPIYVVGFGLLRQGRWSATLPVELPLIGVWTALVALVISRLAGRELTGGVVGLVMNAIPLALALVLRYA